MSKASDPAESACLRVERAGFLARQGFFEEAGSEIDAVRAQFSRQPNASVTVWLCIAEAWMAHFSTLDGVVAHDKMKRALALSSAMNLPRLQALSAAWLAHFDFVRDDMEGMAKNLSLALKIAEPGHHAAQARIGMVAALSYDYARCTDLAIAWYAHARTHALWDNDGATLGAVTYNITANRAIHAFQISIFGGDVNDSISSALAGINASQGMADLFGTVAQNSLLPIVRAMLASAHKDYSQAIALYESHLGLAKQQGFGHMQATHIADLAWCKVQTGDLFGAQTSADTAEELICQNMFFEDRAEAHGRLAQVFELLGFHAKSSLHKEAARNDWTENISMQARVLSLLDEVFKRP